MKHCFKPFSKTKAINNLLTFAIPNSLTRIKPAVQLIAVSGSLQCVFNF